MSKSMEEEKLLVAEKLMKWKPKLSTLVGGNTGYWYPHNKFINDENETIEWNPQKDLNCWPKIWEKLGVLGQRKLMGELGHSYECFINSLFKNLGACWKALIKTLDN